MVRRSRKGNAAFTALSLSVLLAFGAIAVDVAYVRVANAQLQAALDAGVLAGAGYLDGTLAGVEEARARAVAFANDNEVAGDFALDAAQVALGVWTEEDGFVAIGAPTEEDAARINAVRAEVQHTGLHAILAGAAFGEHALSTSAASLAVRDVGGPASEVECFLPFALPDCAFPDDPTSNPPPLRMAFNNQNVKNIGWAHPDGANAKHLKDHFDQPGLCANGMAVGDSLPVMNGVVTAAGKRITDTLNGIGGMEPDPWPYDHFPAGPPDPRNEANFAFADSTVVAGSWGNVISGPIPLVDMGGGPGGCASTGMAPTGFTGSKAITGFVWGFVYDRKDAGGANAHLWLQLDFVHEHAFGTATDPDARGNVISANGPPRLAGP